MLTLYNIPFVFHSLGRRQISKGIDKSKIFGSIFLELTSLKKRCVKPLLLQTAATMKASKMIRKSQFNQMYFG